MFKQKKWFQPFIIITIAVIITLNVVTKTTAQTAQISHPLEPLTAQEITTAVNLLKQKKSLTENARFPNLSLHEPDKQAVLDFQVGDKITREAFVVVLEPKQNKTYEAIVNLNNQTIVSWKEIANVQPAILDEEYELLDQLAKADPRWQAAMKKRGITNFDHAIVDGWALGLMSETEKASGKRLLRGVTYYKDPQRMNYYGSPIEGLMITVDLNEKKVFEVVDRGVTSFSKTNFDYDSKSVAPLQKAPQPLKINQPEGVSFQINKNEVTWQNWKFRYLMHPREGLTLYQISYRDRGKDRPILYKAGLSEMLVPYADTSPAWVVRSAFDVGEYRFGWLSTALEKGKDVPENAVLLPALFADDLGEPIEGENLIGIYERDAGILWRHYDYNTESYEGKRSRELVVSTVAAIGNYDYAISWIFHQDGTLEIQADLTGIMLAKATEAEKENQAQAEKFGTLVAPNVLAVNHQHFMNFRLDFDVDGTKNSITEMDVLPVPQNASNPTGNAFLVSETSLKRETEAVRDLKPSSSRTWVVHNDNVKNELGQPTGYMIMSSGNTTLYPLPDSNISQRGKFATHHLWATNYHPEELYAAGNYPNQSSPNQGLPQWIADNEFLEQRDLVVWYTLGVTHIPRPEEWPIMTVHRAGFKLVSKGFFSQNPVLNVADAD